jgi:hypothetical protein
VAEGVSPPGYTLINRIKKIEKPPAGKNIKFLQSVVPTT